MSIRIENVLPHELEGIKKILKEADLPTEDISENTHFLKALSQGEIVGVVAIEFYERYGLLRSLVVKEAFRKQQIAHQLTEKIAEIAEKTYLDALFLITTSAESYFAKNGFVVIDRQRVPDTIKKSSQFMVVCPSNAIVMIRKIKYFF